MMSIIIRECIMDDCEAIVLLNKNEMGYNFPIDLAKEQLEKLLSDNQHKIYVAVMNTQIVGYIHANNHDYIYAPPMKNIMGIAVVSTYKRRGIGKLLLEAIEKWAVETNAFGVRLVSGATRVDAHCFYRACGYGGDKEQINFNKMF